MPPCDPQLLDAVARRPEALAELRYGGLLVAGLVEALRDSAARDALHVISERGASA